MKLEFDGLLQAVAKGDIEKLQARKAALESEKVGLQDKLTQVNRELAEVEAGIVAPLRNAVRAAQLLGVQIPEKYQSIKSNGNGGEGKRSKGKYYWESNGTMPFRAEVSRAMWRLSRGSGGTAGKNGEGVLTSEEFWTAVKLDESSIKLAEKHTATLPNKKVVTFEKVE